MPNKIEIVIIDLSNRGGISMILRRTSLLVLVSMLVSVIEMTVDPGFFFGRISLAFSGLLMLFLALLFVRNLWRFSSKK